MCWRLNLNEVRTALRQQAAQAFEDGDAEAFVCSCERRLSVIADNIALL